MKNLNKIYSDIECDIVYNRFIWYNYVVMSNRIYNNFNTVWDRILINYYTDCKYYLT